MLGLDILEEALQTLGAVLEQRGLAFEVVVVGGSSLMLLGLINRPTQDLDLAALVSHGEYVRADPLPPQLAAAAADVYAAADLSPGSKHADDLRRLRPTREELAAAARWTMGQDPSEGFRYLLRNALLELGAEDVENLL